MPKTAERSPGASMRLKSMLSSVPGVFSSFAEPVCSRSSIRRTGSERGRSIYPAAGILFSASCDRASRYSALSSSCPCISGVSVKSSSGPSQRAKVVISRLDAAAVSARKRFSAASRCIPIRLSEGRSSKGRSLVRVMIRGVSPLCTISSTTAVLINPKLISSWRLGLIWLPSHASRRICTGGMAGSGRDISTASVPGSAQRVSGFSASTASMRSRRSSLPPSALSMDPY